MREHNDRLPGNALTVVIRDDGPFIHLQEPPTKRSVRLVLTDDQRHLLALRCTGSVGGTPIFESVAQCFIEPDADD